MKSSPNIAVICGPTASGKTALAVELALRLNGEVVSADSMQVYRGMDIGTAKPSEQEKNGVVHHMMDVADPRENYSVAQYVQQAVPIVDDIIARGKLPIVAGGTGLYLDALIAGRQFAPFQPERGVREALARRVREEGLGSLRAELERIDPEAAGRVHPNDEKRTIRALEVWYTTGKTISQHNWETQQVPPRYQAAVIGLNFADRKDLWQRIDRRVDQMMAQGLPDEVGRLLACGVPAQCTAMQAIGYKELCAAIQGEGSLEEAASEIKLRTRQYAKRQLTWFRRMKGIEWHLWEKEPDFSAAAVHSTAFLMAHGLG